MRLFAEGCIRLNSNVVPGTVEVSGKSISLFRDHHGKRWSLKIFSMVYVYSNASGSQDTAWDNDIVWAYPIKDEDYET